MRKVTFFIIIYFFFAVTVNGQEKKPRNLTAFDYKKLHWGFTVGVNSMDYSLVRNPAAAGFLYTDVQGFQPAGFQVNIVSDLRLSDFWTLRFLPGINLGSRHFYYFDPDSFQQIYDMTIGSSFLDFPLVFKYRSERVNNYRPYVIGGLSYRYDMSARDDYPGPGDNRDGDDRILVKKGNIYLEVGFGIDNYLQYFKFAPELKLAIGLRNMMNDTPFPNEEYYANSISSLRSFLIMLNFHFE